MQKLLEQGQVLNTNSFKRSTTSEFGRKSNTGDFIQSYVEDEKEKESRATASQFFGQQDKDAVRLVEQELGDEEQLASDIADARTRLDNLLTN